MMMSSFKKMIDEIYSGQQTYPQQSEFVMTGQMTNQELLVLNGFATPLRVEYNKSVNKTFVSLIAIENMD